jgi:uncharacterized membrane protein
MAETGDPPHSREPADDHDDDLIGFASPASLEGRTRVVEESAPDPVPEPLPEPVPEPVPEPMPAPEPEPMAEPVRAALPEPAPVEVGAIFAPSREFSTRPRPRDEAVSIPGGGTGLYAVYALILFAVPTLGASAALGLFAVTGRARPQDALSSSHFVYQQRTLWAAAVAAVAGVILMAAPFALGVPILFGLALWMALRGARGVWALKSGRAITDPRGWWI